MYLDHWKKKFKKEYQGTEIIDDKDLVTVKTRTGRVAYVQKGLTKKKREDEIKKTPIKTRIVWKYHEEIGNEICEMVSAGATLAEISRTEGYPPITTIFSWKATHRDFRENLREAIGNRAHTLRDKALETADRTEDSSDVPAAKLKIDTYKWAAEKDNPTDFGPVTKQDQLPTQPIQILIDTGIDRREINIQSIVTAPNDLVLEDKGISHGDDQTKTEDPSDSASSD